MQKESLVDGFQLLQTCHIAENSIGENQGTLGDFGKKQGTNRGFQKKRGQIGDFEKKNRKNMENAQKAFKYAL